MTKMICIPAEGQIQVLEAEADLETIKGLLDGGWLEIVLPSTEVAQHWLAYIDEEGKLKNLPINYRATALARTYGWMAADVLVGPAVFMGYVPGGEDESDVPEELITTLLEEGLIQS